MNRNTTLRAFAFLLLLAVVPFVSCKKEQSQIPYVPVNITVNINNPGFIDLNAVGGWTYVTGGSRGIVVYRLSQDEFMTFDRHSPYLPDNDCTVEVDSSNIILEDPCSGSRFLLTDGSVVEGPAALPLLRYQNTFDGTILNIFNWFHIATARRPHLSSSLSGTSLRLTFVYLHKKALPNSFGRAMLYS